MNKYGGATGASGPFGERDAAQAAESIERDFHRLIALFDGELGRLPPEHPADRSHIAEARQSAERGLELAQSLIELLRKPR